jgi:hypothetical protein
LQVIVTWRALSASQPSFLLRNAYAEAHRSTAPSRQAPVCLNYKHEVQHELEVQHFEQLSQRNCQQHGIALLPAS